MDQGHEETDALLQEMEQKIRKQYAQAAKELTEKLEKHLKQFEEKDKMMLSRLDAGEITDAEYFRWRTGQIMTGKRWEQMRDQLAADLVHSHQLADSVVNGYLPEVYALNHNYGTYQIEHDLQMSTSYTLYNRQAVERLLRDDPDMLPQPNVNVPKAERWNKQHIQSAVLQGILQGESMDKIARRMRDVCGMDARAAIRNARTATTGAENAGRLDSMNRAIGLGVGLKKMWLATRDSRTRDSHVLLDGELREVNEKFSNGCMHPGDPHGAPAEVYNCRCAMRSKVDGADPYSPDLSRNQRLGGMSYDEWKHQAGERFYNRLFRKKEVSERVNSLLSFPGVDENKNPLHPVTPEIQNAKSFEEIKNIIVQNRPIKGLVPVLDDSIGKYSLEIQKEIAEGLLWAKRELRIKTWPEKIKREKLSPKKIGDYNKYTQTIRFRPGLSIEDAFTTAVHEMVHHSHYLTDIDCGKIIEEAALAAGLDRRTNEFKNMRYFIAGEEEDKSYEVVAYSVEVCAVQKGNLLAQAIYESYRKKSRRK